MLFLLLPPPSSTFLLHFAWKLGQAKWRTWKNPRMKWAKHFYNLIKHWFSFSHFTDIFTGDDDVDVDVESICHTENEVLCDLFYCPAGLSWVSFLPPLSLSPCPTPLCRLLPAWSVFGFVLRFLVVVSCQLGALLIYIYIIYVYVACTLCYLLCRQDVAGGGSTEANVKLILPNCQLSDLYFEMNSKRTRRLASQSGQYKRQFVANM